VDRRDFFATNAPLPVPEWFDHVLVQPRPDNSAPYSAQGTFETKEEYAERAREAHRAQRIAINRWKFVNDEARFFQWRWYYADKMIETGGIS